MEPPGLSGIVPPLTRYGSGPMYDRMIPRKSRKSKAEDAPHRCHRCNGTGVAPCRTCGGTGKLFRGADRNGRSTYDRCEGCFGRKTTRCPTCLGQLFI